jgi:prepilin-type N-terminal cleavage/methylation domain-containing protein/prepilin-type processing-associated H-X9-DG protein
MKKAFSLVELLVVIGILAILMGVLVVTTSGGTESARAARCLTNMRNLATACNTAALSRETYPLAGSAEVKDMSGGVRESRGWVSWDSRDAYTENGGTATEHKARIGWFTSAYCDNDEVRIYALTNGAIWKSVSGNADVFVCPAHRRTMKSLNPIWSYVMNERFGYDRTLGAYALRSVGIEYGKLSRADRTLMFAEMQFLANDKIEVDTDSSAGIKNDCTLQYGQKEVIGCNHPNGKLGLSAHVAFADCHVEKLTVPATKGSRGWSLSIGRSDLEDLTKWLCEGKDVTFNSKTKKYEEFKK